MYEIQYRDHRDSRSWPFSWSRSQKYTFSWSRSRTCVNRSLGLACWVCTCLVSVFYKRVLCYRLVRWYWSTMDNYFNKDDHLEEALSAVRQFVNGNWEPDGLEKLMPTEEGGIMADPPAPVHVQGFEFQAPDPWVSRGGGRRVLWPPPGIWTFLYMYGFQPIKWCPCKGLAPPWKIFWLHPCPDGVDIQILESFEC